MKQSIEHLLKLLPARPWVYQMMGKTGKILYVGKSVHLKNRVSSYFNGTSKLNAAKSQMVGQVESIEWIETSTEIEALVLETNLIKKHRPKYNILMKDDKNLTYIAIGGGPIPEVYRTRQKPEGTFFGPYTSGTNVSHTLRTLRRIFKIRACRMRFGVNEQKQPVILAKAGKVPPCMDYYIGLCPAPCLLEQDKIQAHSQNVEALKKFLRGQMGEVLTELRETMMKRAKDQQFEEAQKIKEQIEAIGMLGQKQIARDAVRWSYDSIVFLEKYDAYFLGITPIRNGEIQGVHHIKIESWVEESAEEIFEHALAEYYSGEEGEECITLLMEHPILSDVLLEYLHKRNLSLEVPSQGTKTDLLTFTKTNLIGFAYRDAMEHLTKKTLSKGTMKHILEEIGYSVPETGAITFECYDNSHTNGQFTVASRSVIVNGKADTSLYRKYKLKTLEEDKIDDFESMREIMQRRTIEGFEQDNFPTLIILDGGKGQLSSALEWVERAIQILAERQGGLPDRKKLPSFCSLAKREEEIFTPECEESVRFEHGSAELMLLQQIRDEAHRFAINFNRSSRSKAMKKNILEELPGFGPVTRKKLLKLAGSVDGIRELPLDAIESICTKPQIEILQSHGLLDIDK